jgi:uncharacterized protein (DUF58 family)
MGFSSGQVSKFRYGCCLAAALAYLMIKQRDAVGLVVFDNQIRSYIPPRSVGSHLSTILKELDNTQTSSGTRVKAVFHQLAERIKRRGLIIIISDLLDDPDQILLGLKHFRHRKHEVIVFHVLDPRERDFDFEAESTFGPNREIPPGLSRQPDRLCARGQLRGIRHRPVQISGKAKKAWLVLATLISTVPRQYQILSKNGFP